MFSVHDRDRVRDRVLDLASSDPRVVAGAVVGSLAHGEGDRWSDLDLTFGVADGVPVTEVLSDWTRDLVDKLDAVHLFDLPSAATIYRVFLLPGCLQFDLSFTPASEFAASSPKFRLLFGSDLPARRGIGFDDLPAGVRDAFKDALVRSLERDELLRALASAVSVLMRESAEVRNVVPKVEAHLRELTRRHSPIP